MSIRTNPVKAVPTLLKRLVNVEKHADLKDLKSELIKIKDLFSIVKKNEDELLDTLTVVDSYVRNSNMHKLMEEKEEICKRIKISSRKLLPRVDHTQSTIDTHESLEKPFQANGALSLIPQLRGSLLRQVYNELETYQKACFLSLLFLFPKNAIIKKRNLFFWWKTVLPSIEYNGVPEANLEFQFDCLLNGKLIVPHAKGKCPVMKKVKINPSFYDESMKPFLNSFTYKMRFCETYSQIINSSHHDKYKSSHRLTLDKNKVKLSDELGFKSTNWRAVLNVGASYLNFGSQWMAKMERLEVLQLGRWLHDSDSHHIEVNSVEFLKELRGHKYLKYLSLRGI